MPLGRYEEPLGEQMGFVTNTDKDCLEVRTLTVGPRLRAETRLRAEKQRGRGRGGEVSSDRNLAGLLFTIILDSQQKAQQRFERVALMMTASGQERD